MKNSKIKMRQIEESIKLRIELEKLIQEAVKGLHEEAVILETQMERTTLALQFEREANDHKAVRLYQKNVEDETIDPESYMRLALSYGKTGQLSLEIKTLEKALVVFENLSFKQSNGFSDQLAKLQQVIMQSQAISDNLNASDGACYGEQIILLKKRLEDSHRKNEK